MRYKLIASDLDGTLVDDDKQISADNIAAISKAIDSGVYFAICSGRSPYSLKTFNKIIGLDKPGCYGIGFNGGIVYRADTMEILYENRVKQDFAVKTIEILKQNFPQAPIMTYMAQDLLYYDCGEEHVHAYAAHSGIRLKKVAFLEKSIDCDVLKIIIRWDVDKIQDLMSSTQDEIKPYCDMFLSQDNFLEFAPAGSNKATGIKFLADYLGLDMNETAAIGDNYNDIDMIQKAGLGAAVSNAVKEVKEVADYITKADNNNSAVKEVIEIVLNERAIG